MQGWQTTYLGIRRVLNHGESVHQLQRTIHPYAIGPKWSEAGPQPRRAARHIRIVGIARQSRDGLEYGSDADGSESVG